MQLDPRASQISQILKKRQPLAKRVDDVEHNLQALGNTLEQVEAQRNQLLNRIDDQRVQGNLQAINCGSLRRAIEQEISSLVDLKTRLSRSTLNIGVVGRARQGKSRLLQSITGLSSREIPDGDGQHCTGVRSDIHHNPNVETYAEVHFHTERSFLIDVLTPYYHSLHLGSLPQSLESFITNPLPELPQHSAQQQPLAKAKYEHLRRYHQDFYRYKELLTELSPKQISQDTIREFVAQDNIDGQRIYFNYMAVKQVNIFCPFPHQDVGQVAVIDMPGLGDTGIGDAERMISTLSRDVDIVLFVRMPKSNGDFWSIEDVELYGIANSALTELPIEKWSFMVVNHVRDALSQDGNLRLCQSLKDSIAEKHIDIQDTIIADCSDVGEVQSQILDRVLTYLADKIESLDRQYASVCQERLVDLQRVVNAELSKASTAWGEVYQDAWFPEFVRLFEIFWRNLTQGLDSLLASMQDERDTHDEQFKDAVQTIIAKCRADNGIPSVDIIREEFHASGAYMTAYAECSHVVRTHLSKQFLGLDFALKGSLEQAKTKVAQTLKERGNLGRLADGEGSEFLNNLYEKIPDNLSGLKLGFKILATFDLEYRGLIQHRIRKHLDPLQPREADFNLSRNTFWDRAIPVLNRPEQSADKNIADALQKAHTKVVNNCERELVKLLQEPKQAAFAIVEEFIDRVLRSEGVQAEWQIFLQEYASEVWIDEFGQRMQYAQLRRDWLQQIDEAKALNSPEKTYLLT